MGYGCVPVARRRPPAVPATDVAVEPPPDLPSPSAGALASLVPVAMSVASMGAMAAMALSGWGAARNPLLLTFPALMLVSTLVTAAARRGPRPSAGVDAGRADYLGYLSRLRAVVRETAAAQSFSLDWCHPDPDTLWTLTGGPRMWERGAADPDFLLVRVGIGTQPLATRLVAPQTPPGRVADPVTTAALHRFLDAHSTIVGPVTIGLHGRTIATIDGDATAARGLLRAIVCQLAVWHSPDQLLVVCVVSEGNRPYWEWLKWLPHNQHPGTADSAGPTRMVYRHPSEARHALTGIGALHVVVVADLDGDTVGIAGATTLAIGAGCPGAALEISLDGEARPLPCPDRLDPTEALVCARRLAPYRVATRSVEAGRNGWPDLAGLGDVNRFDPLALWRSQDHRDRLRAPIGVTVDGAALTLDIKEPAENGMGPHGICIGATGSGKSELLRTIALGMIARNPPELLNLLLVDFKGGATFLDFASAPHVAAVITNLADEAPLVARMRDALAGELNRRQRLLKLAGSAGITAYQRECRAGASLIPLPVLFVIVDEFSELLSQHPEFTDTFAAVGRLGRSLGIHLLLASQRLDEGRLRGLEAHLSYRICLKTLSAGESRTTLGTLDAYHLPNTPGAGYLRTGDGELIRFQAAFVSGRLRPGNRAGPAAANASVCAFGSRPAGTVSRAVDPPRGPEVTLLQAVLDRLSGCGPRAHHVWLPPLGPAPQLHTLLREAAAAPAGLTVPIGVVDRPFEQCRTPLVADLSGAAGNVAIIGAPRSGKSTALRTLMTALAATHGADQVQFYCLDFGGGALASMHSLPHVGAVAGRAEPRLVGRIVAECESVARSREAGFAEHGIESIDQYRQLRARGAGPGGDPFGDVFLVVDGWTGLRHEFEALEESITVLAAQGLSFGVHVVISASRWADVRPALRDQIGTRVELRLGDPADSELDRKAAQRVPRARPGHGLAHDGLHMVIATPVAAIPSGGAVAPPIPLLPDQIDLDTVIRRASSGAGGPVLLGLEERSLRPVPVDFERGAHLMVLGDNACGKTSALRTLCREIVRTSSAARAQLLIVDYRRSLLGVIESEHLGGYAVSPGALDALLPGVLDLLRQRMPPPDATQAELRTRSWWSGPDIYVLVDDYDLVATAAGNPLGAMVEYLPYATDLGLHLVVARRSRGAERAMFEPLLASLGELGCMALMMNGTPGETRSFGPGRPTRLPPGRGVLRTPDGDDQLVQVAWSAP